MSYGDVYLANERQQAAHAFEHANIDRLMTMFTANSEECHQLAEQGLALPAYDHCMKCSHLFNLLDARGAISVAERARYIGRIRKMALACAQAWKEASR